jgi:hypothetical protein
MKTSLPQVARILQAIDESPKVRTLVLDLHLEAAPGQFVMAWLPGVDEKPFSLVRAGPATLTVARVGPFSTAVHTLGVGDRLWLRGPLGQPFTLPRAGASGDGSRLLLVGGGYGVAPLYFLAECARTSGWAADMVIGARTAADGSRRWVSGWRLRRTTARGASEAWQRTSPSGCWTKRAMVPSMPAGRSRCWRRRNCWPGGERCRPN